MGACVPAHLKVFDGLLHVYASKCWFTSVCAFLMIIYHCYMNANFPTVRFLPAKDENVQSVKHPMQFMQCCTVFARPQGCFAKLYCRFCLDSTVYSYRNIIEVGNQGF